MHHERLAALEAAGHCRVVAACDPRAGEMTRERRSLRLATRGVEVFHDFGRMLEACASRTDYVVISTPPHMHAHQHAMALHAGLPVYMEKPPTLVGAELAEMIRLDRDNSTMVGFAHLLDPQRLVLRRRLAAGDFGRMLSVTLAAIDPRTAAYYRRNNWAGRKHAGGHPVFDSCLGNAKAHAVQNILCWAGACGLTDWAGAGGLVAGFWRAHDIEGPDTVFVSARLPGGIPLRIALSHAGRQPGPCLETVECERAVLVAETGLSLEVRWRDGGVELLDSPDFDGLEANHLAFQAFLRGHAPRPGAGLADCRGFVALNEQSWRAAGEIREFPHVVRKNLPDGNVMLEVPGLMEKVEAFVTGNGGGAH